MKETLCRGFPTLSRDEQTALGHGVRAFTRLPRGRGGPVGRAVWKRLAFGLLRAVVWNPIQSRASSFDHANCEPGFFVAIVESSSRKSAVGRGVEYPKKRWGESFGLEVVRAWLTSRGSSWTCICLAMNYLSGEALSQTVNGLSSGGSSYPSKQELRLCPDLLLIAVV